jgi:hypothetical protein
VDKYGCLWFIDATGAYPVRAHCMGGGTVDIVVRKDGKNIETKTVPLADVINRQLLYELRRTIVSSNDSTLRSAPLPFFDMSTDDAFIMILDLLSREFPSTIQTPSHTLIPPKSRLELVCVLSSESHKQSYRRRNMIRKHISDVWGIKKSRLLLNPIVSV